MHFFQVTVTIPHWTKMPKLCRLLHLYVLEWTLFDDHVAFPIISWYICIFLFAYHGEALINCQALYFFQESLLQVFSGLSRVVWELWAVWLTPNLCRFDLGWADYDTSWVLGGPGCVETDYWVVWASKPRMMHTFSCYITPEHALATTAVGSHEGITDTWAASALNWLFEQLLKFEKNPHIFLGLQHPAHVQR